MAELSVVGKSVLRTDALAKATGRAKYPIDVGVGLPGRLCGKVLYSPYPHARILSINTSKAERLPGVKAVMTGRDLPKSMWGRDVQDQRVLALDRVRFVGDAVAAVAAKTIETAEEAIDLIEVEYEELPAVFDAEEAMKTDCPVIIHPDLAHYNRQIYPELGRDLPAPNVHTHHRIRRGNVDDGFQKSDLIVENRYSTTRIAHSTLDLSSTTAYLENDGTLTVWPSVHCQYSIAVEIGRYFGIPLSKMRVRTEYLGGAFGSTPRAYMFAALLALKTGEPVKVVFSREECFVRDCHRLPVIIYVKDGVKSNGTLLAREMKLICNGGAYVDLTSVIIRNSSFGVSQYRIPNFKWDAYGVYTNAPICGGFRGFGNSQVFWALEQQTDIIAEKLGLDSVDLRKKNLIKEGEENIRGEITHSIGAEECLDRAAEWIKWGKPCAAPALGSFIKKGKGIALANKYTMVDTVSAAIVKIHRDGTIEFRHGSEEVGQGANTALSQIVAEEFNVPMEKVKVVWGDTTVVPYDFGSVSSRTTFMTGNAIRLACQDAKKQLFKLAAPVLGADPEDLVTGDGRVFSRKSPEKSITIGSLFVPQGKGAQKAALCLDKEGELLGKGTFLIANATDEDRETGRGTRLTATYGYAAQATEVAVDTETGVVKVLRWGNVFDMGQPINPKMCEGQMEGGTGMGIGSALYEGLIMDNGKLINPNFTDYRFPSTMEIPCGDNVKSMTAKAPHRDGPFGAKGAGEAAMTPSAPAIANAIYNAVGVRIKDLPITAEKVLKALKEKGE